MAGTITVGELLSDPSSSNKITIGTGTTLDLVSGAGSVTGVGKVLQVVHSIDSTQTNISAQNVVTSTGTSASITPSSNSKVLVMYTSGNVRTGNGGGNGTHINLYRDSTDVVRLAWNLGMAGSTGDFEIEHSSNYLDVTPGGDGSTVITYSIKAQYAGTDQVIFQYSGAASTITLMEIGA
jgi:hypothetical protein